MPKCSSTLRTHLVDTRVNWVATCSPLVDLRTMSCPQDDTPLGCFPTFSTSHMSLFVFSITVYPFLCEHPRERKCETSNCCVLPFPMPILISDSDSKLAFNIRRQLLFSNHLCKFLFFKANFLFLFSCVYCSLSVQPFWVYIILEFPSLCIYICHVIC